jgi:hypothetical protein
LRRFAFMNFKKAALALSVAGAAVFAGGAGVACAESSIVSGGAGPFSTSARLDFAIVVPRFLQFQVGTAGATINAISFNVAAANVGSGTAQTGTGGNLGSGVVTVNIRANAGQVTITPSNNSGGTGLRNGVAGQTISYTQILTTSSDAANVPAPTLSNAGGAAVTPALSAGTVTNRTATWTYTYANTTVPSAGTYGTAANGGRVTYTASTP